MQKKFIPHLICALMCFFIFNGCASFSTVTPQASLPAAEEYSGRAAYHYSLAVLMRLDGDLAGAIEQLRQAVAVQPESSYLVTELVSLYIENSNVDRALSTGEAELARNPGNLELRSMMGGLYFNLRENGKAIREYQTIIDRDPKNLVAYLYLATIYTQEKKYDLAEQSYQKILAMDPDNIIGRYYYAKTLTQMNRLPEAEAFYQKIILQRPAFEAAWLELAALYESQKKYDEAITLYRRYLEQNPARIGFRVKIAEMLMKDNRNEEAQKEFQDILKVDPDNGEIQMALGLFYYDLRRYEEAQAQFAKLLETKPADDKLRYLFANALEQKGDVLKARDEYQKISPGFELFANARIHAAMILKKEGRLTEAIGVMTQSILLKDDQAVSYLYLSSLYEDAKNLAAAEKTVMEGVRRFPQNADMHYVLGTILEKTKRFDESIRSMEKVLEIDPQNADALNFIGYTYADRGIHLDQAEQLILQALKIKPDSGYILDSLGWVHFRKGQYDSALKNLKRALELLPDDANVMEHLGDVYFKIGRETEAQNYYRKALQIDPDNGVLKQKIKSPNNKK